jgi:hypothetical protein
MPYKDRQLQLEAQKRLDRRRRQVRLDFVNEYKESYGCYFCDETSAVVLDLHHTDPTTKYETVSDLVAKCRPLGEIQVEMEKCIVVCSNCHRKIHAGMLTL